MLSMSLREAQYSDWWSLLPLFADYCVHSAGCTVCQRSGIGARQFDAQLLCVIAFWRNIFKRKKVTSSSSVRMLQMFFLWFCQSDLQTIETINSAVVAESAHNVWIGEWWMAPTRHPCHHHHQRYTDRTWCATAWSLIREIPRRATVDELVANKCFCPVVIASFSFLSQKTGFSVSTQASLAVLVWFLT